MGMLCHGVLVGSKSINPNNTDDKMMDDCGS